MGSQFYTESNLRQNSPRQRRVLSDEFTRTVREPWLLGVHELFFCPPLFCLFSCPTWQKDEHPTAMSNHDNRGAHSKNRAFSFACFSGLGSRLNAPNAVPCFPKFSTSCFYQWHHGV